MSRARNKPQSGRSKAKRSSSPTRLKKVSPIKKKEIPSVALTIPSQGWAEWMQGGIDWVSSWIFPQRQPDTPSDIDRTDPDLICTHTDTDVICTNINTDVICTNFNMTNTDITAPDLIYEHIANTGIICRNIDTIHQDLIGTHTTYTINTDLGCANTDITNTDLTCTNTDITDTTQPISLVDTSSIINGFQPWGNMGVAVAGGDPNQDGLGDIGIVSPFIQRFDLVAGSPKLESPLSLPDPNGFYATGEQPGGFFGSAVAMDNRGVAVSDCYASPGGVGPTGETWLIPGDSKGKVNLSSPEVKKLVGMEPGEQSGYALALGDRLVDGDVKRLVISTAPFACRTGKCGNFEAEGVIYGVYDSADLPNSFNLGDLYDAKYNVDGSKGFVIQGRRGDQLGCDVAYSEKLGLLLAGAALGDSDGNSPYRGTGYLLRLDLLPTVFNLSDMNATYGYIIYGPHKNAKLGAAVDFVYNFFGDGQHAVILAAPEGNPDVIRFKAGMAFAVRLVPDLPSIVDLSDPTIVSKYAVQFNGARALDNAGIAVSAVGDNILIAAVTGSEFRGAIQPGLTYLVNKGEFSSFPYPFELASLNGTLGNQYIGGQVNTRNLITSSCVGASNNVYGDGRVWALISQYTATPNSTLPGAGQIYGVPLGDVSSPNYETQAFQYLSVIKPEVLYQASVQYLSKIDFNSVYEASISGGLRGAGRIIEEKLEQTYNSMVSKSVNELFYGLSYAAFIYWNHYNKAVAEGDELSASYKAMAETYNDMLIWLGARFFFEGVVAKSFAWVAASAEERGYSRVAGWLRFWGNNASTGAYFQSAISREGVPGVLNAACTLFGGVVAERVAKGLLRPLLIEPKLEERLTNTVECRI